MKPRGMNLWFPTGGMVRRHAYQSQPPYTTYRSENCWPIEVTELRQRGGRRAGLVKQAAQSAGGKWRFLAGIPKADDEQYAYRIMGARGSTLYYGEDGTLAEWATGTLTSTTGRVPWAIQYSDLYVLDGGTLRVIKSWDPSIADVAATAGSLPTGCNLLKKYNNRCILAKKRGHVWYASRARTWTDWDYSADLDDMERAVWAQTSEAGELQDPLNAIAPSGDDYMVFGCDNSLWVMRGDPAAGGRIDNLSRQVGIVCDDAWTFTPEGHLVFMDWSGVFILPAGAVGKPQPFSLEKLPADLKNIDPYTYDVILAWEPDHNGMLLSIMPITGGTDADPGEHWWIDWPTRTFWEWSFPVSKAPRWREPFAWDAGYDHKLFLACDDGYLRTLDDAASDDDGTAIDASVAIGPFRLSGNDRDDGLLRELTGTLAADSGNCTWSIYAGATAEEAAKAATARATGTWVAKRNYTVNPRVRGGAAVLELSGPNRWIFETANAVLETLGKQRGV